MGVNAVKLFIAVILFVITINLYFLSVILTHEVKLNKLVSVKDSETKPKSVNIKQELVGNDIRKAIKDSVTVLQINTTLVATNKILSTLKNVRNLYKSLTGYRSVRKQFKTILNDFTNPAPVSVSTQHLWKTASKWISSRELLPLHGTQMLSNILDALSTSKIVKADNTSKGTQLKVLLTLEGGQNAIFKPQWYKRDEVITGPVYAGKDRHNGELAAFYLSAILNMRRAPITVGRKLNLRQELMPFSASSLLDTFYQEGNRTCFYGVCYYCRPNEPVCDDNYGILEGAVSLLLPTHMILKKYRHPWQRSYQSGVQTRWETDSDYCRKVRRNSMYSHGPRLLDLVDTSVFDFLIDNGDRHHYEVFKHDNHSMVILLDNGKSFGNPNMDHIDILAPLYQCCRVRQSTWSQLWSLRSGELSNQLSQLLHKSRISPVLMAPHFAALDRRLDIILAAIHVCIKERNGQEHVFVID